MEDVPVTTLSLVDPSVVSMTMISRMDHPTTPLIGVASSSLADPSLVNNPSITTVSQSAPPIGVTPLSLVDPSLVNNTSITTVSSATDPALLSGVTPLSFTDPLATEVNDVTDHSATSLNNVTHINGDLNAQLHMMLMLMTLSTVTSDMSSKEPIPVCNASMVSHASLKPLLLEPLLGLLVMGLGNPEASATEMLIDTTATAPSKPPLISLPISPPTPLRRGPQD
jgi:hypothetical protein